jgi:hypothetical protein
MRQRRQRRLGEAVLRRIAPGVGVSVALFIALSRYASAADESGEAPKPPESSPSPKTKEPPPRPPPLQVERPPYDAFPRWERHIEVGGDIVHIYRPASLDGESAPTGVRYVPAIGYGVHGRFDVVKYLRFTGYVLVADHTVALPEGALGLDADLTMEPVSTFVLGARLAPTWPWSERGRTWLSVGVGWGRLEFGRMEIKEAAGAPFEARERSSSFVEIPLGIGVSYEIIPRWLAIDFEVLGAFVLGQEGTSIKSAQAIDSFGRIRSVGGLPLVDASFVQTLGLSLIL